MKVDGFNAIGTDPTGTYHDQWTVCTCRVHWIYELYHLAADVALALMPLSFAFRL